MVRFKKDKRAASVSGGPEAAESVRQKLERIVAKVSKGRPRNITLDGPEDGHEFKPVTTDQARLGTDPDEPFVAESPHCKKLENQLVYREGHNTPSLEVRWELVVVEDSDVAGDG
jgi:hypothetical protein